jgi:hypothetical protein
MIRVTRSDRPDCLAIGERLTEEFKRDYETAPEPYRSGLQIFKIDRAIYGHTAVKNALRVAQHAKCCFCEGRFEANAAADVDTPPPLKPSDCP